MFWVVVAMAAVLLVAFVVIGHVSEDERREPGEGHLEDLLDP